MKIIRNSARCLICDIEIVSTSRHDFTYCECKNVFVDGGFDYIRHGFSDEYYYDNTSLTDDE